MLNKTDFYFSYILKLTLKIVITMDLRIKKLFFILLAVTLFSCSESQKVIKENKENDKFFQKTEHYFKNQTAKEKFINGLIREEQGDYTGAILDYYDALNYDSSAGIYFALAKNYYRLNRISNAIKNIQIAEKKDSTNIDFKLFSAEIYRYAKLYDRAIDEYKKALALDSLNIKALYGLAQLYEAKRPTDAMNLYKKLLKVTGPRWDVLFAMADLSTRMGNLPETIDYTKKLIKINPSEPVLKKILVELYIRNKQYDDALKVVNDLIPLYPDDLQLWQYKADIYVLKKDWKNSYKTYLKIIQSNDVPLQSKFTIATSYINQFEQDKDTVLLDYAKNLMLEIDADTLDWRIKATLGDIYQRAGKDSLAIEYLKQAANEAEWNSNIWIQLGGLLFDTGRYKEAAETLTKVADNFPDNYYIHWILGLAYGQIKEFEKSKKHLLRAANLNPNDANINQSLAFTLTQLKKYDEALQYLEKAKRINPNNAQVYSMMGMIYDDLEQWGKCNDAYEHALAIDSSNILIMNNYAYSLSKQNKDLDKALKLVNKALEKAPDNGSYLDTKGWILFKLGKIKKAKDYVERALKKDKASAEVNEHMGEILLKLGNKKEALKYFEKAKELDPNLKGLDEKISELKNAR